MRYLIAFFLLCLFKNAYSQEKDTVVQIFRFVEQMPEAQYNVNQYLSSHILYPDSAKQYHIEGRLNVQFVVMSTGDIDSIKIVGNNRLGYGCEQEAIRVVKSMPRWKPAKQNGAPVNAYYAVPVIFKLPEEQKK
jgi:protein TonB